MARGRASDDDWLWTYADVLLLSFFGMCVLAFVALASINPPAKEADNVPPPGDMMICMTWQGHNDLDLWATAPGQDIATGYAHKGGKVLDLVRDDLGTDDSEPVRMECQFARGLPDGRWIVNVHGYSVLDKAVKAHIEVRMGTNGLKLLLSEDIDIRQAQEITVAQFRLAGGQVVAGSLNNVYVPLRSAKK